MKYWLNFVFLIAIFLAQGTEPSLPSLSPRQLPQPASPQISPPAPLKVMQRQSPPRRVFRFVPIPRKFTKAITDLIFDPGARKDLQKDTYLPRNNSAIGRILRFFLR